MRFLAFLRDAVLVALMVAGGYWLYQNHNTITDWWYLRSYTPPAQVAELAAKADFTPAGQHLFYRAAPQIDDTRAAMASHCHIASDRTIELGCYLSSDHIYLLSITQPELADEMVVTAGHETLHAAYARLSSGERRTLDAELEQAARGITDPHLQQRLSDYSQLEPGERDNELHSILGTEYANLSPALEAHYAKYFTNRSRIVAYSQQFNATFDGLHDRIVARDQRIQSLRATMNRYLRQGQIGAYNNLVPVINGEISTYNEEVQRYNQYAGELLGLEQTQIPQ